MINQLSFATLCHIYLSECVCLSLSKISNGYLYIYITVQTLKKLSKSNYWKIIYK